MNLKFRCLPELHGHIPEPVEAAEALPDWLELMPATVQSEVLGGELVHTFRQLPSIMNSFSAGIMFKLPCDLGVKDGEFFWNWSKPVSPRVQLTRSPLGFYAPEQATGMPLGVSSGDFILKFNNFWSIEAPSGTSLVFTHPLNREDLPFRTLSGIVDCDQAKGDFVHFPAIWKDTAFEGTLAAGTPIAQAFAFKRKPVALDCGPMNDEEFTACLEVQSQIL